MIFQGKPSGSGPLEDGDIPSEIARDTELPVASGAGDGTPAMDGTAARGSSAHYARADHVHPTDTSRAAASHTHAASDLASGQVSKARGGTGVDLSAIGNNKLLGTSGAGAFQETSIGTGLSLSSGTLSTTGGGVDTGAIALWGTGTPPSGWLACDGSAVSRSTYASLFGLVGTTFGSGNGSTTFNLPDLRGRTPIGVGTGTGLTARALADQVGSESVTLTAAQSGLPSHTHAMSRGTSAISYNGDYTMHAQVDAGTPGAPTASAGGTSASQSHTNMQPSLALNFIIKT